MVNRLKKRKTPLPKTQRFKTNAQTKNETTKKTLKGHIKFYAVLMFTINSDTELGHILWILR